MLVGIELPVDLTLTVLDLGVDENLSGVKLYAQRQHANYMYSEVNDK
jgi:hypothetical protein